VGMVFQSYALFPHMDVAGNIGFPLRLRGVAKGAIAERVEQARVVPDWDALVGAQIAGVTAPHAVTHDGTLFVGVKSHAWMSELSLMEPQIIAALNRVRAGRDQARDQSELVEIATAGQQQRWSFQQVQALDVRQHEPVVIVQPLSS